MYYITVYWVSMHLYWLLVIIYIYIIKLKTIWDKSVLSDTRIIENMANDFIQDTSRAMISSLHNVVNVYCKS
jgi:hypothetical protein